MTLTPVFVHYMPEILEEGNLYISMEYEVAIHLCACGCKEKSVTPFTSAWGWILVNKNNSISLIPSILNKSCNAHYFITDNKVIWC